MSEQVALEGFRALVGTEVLILSLGFMIFWALNLAGRAVFGVAAPRAVLAILGLTVIYALFVIGSFLSPGLSIQLPLFLLGLLAIFGAWRSRNIVLQDSFYMMAALMFVSPLILLALVVNEPLWDDYTHWLVSAQFLIREGHMPTADTVVVNNSHPSYPYARALLHAWVNGISGGFSINVQGLFNIFFASTLLLWIPHWLGIMHKQTLKFQTALAGMASFSCVIILWAALLSNTMIISSYADPVYAILMVHLFFVLSTDDYQKGSFSRATARLDPVLICLFAAPLILKQSGIYFSIIMFGMFWLYGVGIKINTDRNLKIGELARKTGVQSLYLIPMFGLHLIWSLYVNSQNIKKSFSLRAQEFWNFDILHLIIKGVGFQMAARPYAGLAAIIIILLLMIWLMKGPKILDRSSVLLPLSLGFFLLTALFQILAYSVAFTEFEAIRGASFNRYVAPAGLVMWSSILIYVIRKLPLQSMGRQHAIGSGVVLSLFLLVIGSAEKIVPLQRTNPALIDVANTIKKTYPQGKKLMILDLLGNGIEATIIRFYLDSHMEAAYVNRYRTDKKITPAMLKEWLKGFDHYYVHSVPDYVLPMFGVSEELYSVGQRLRKRYPRGENILIIDLLGDGAEGAALSLMLKNRMNVTLRRKIDIESQMTADEILMWLDGQQHVYIHSAPEQIKQLFHKALKGLQ